MQQIGVAGDDVAAGGRRTGVAHFQFEFSDTYKAVRLSEARYETNGGEVCASHMDEARGLFAALRDGYDDAALARMSREQLAEVKSGCVGGGDEPAHRKYAAVFLQKDQASPSASWPRHGTRLLREH